MPEKCQRCGEEGEDRRTLWMACFYAMNELAIPFEQVELHDKKFFTLRVCKECRGHWMTAILNWFNEKPNAEPVNSGIFVRRYGTNVEISEEEWYRLNPDRDPVRVKTED